MNKPNNYEEVKAGGSYTPISAGGHHLIIKKVEEMKSSTGKDMLRVYLDTANNDSQPAFFTNEFKNDIRPDKKWPHAGTQYIVVEDNEGKCSRSFKAFMTSFENSNNCEAIWGDTFASQFKDKKIGGVFGQVENEYNGKVTMRNELRWFCADDKVADAKVPEPKYLEKKTSQGNDMEFMNVEEGAGDTLPF
jgi:hypothetical protein